MYQVDPNRKFTVNSAFELGKKIVREDGVIALWRGNGVQMLRVIPYAATSFFAFPKYLEKRRLSERWKRKFGNADLCEIRCRCDVGCDGDDVDVSTRLIAREICGRCGNAQESSH